MNLRASAADDLDDDPLDLDPPGAEGDGGIGDDPPEKKESDDLEVEIVDDEPEKPETVDAADDEPEATDEPDEDPDGLSKEDRLRPESVQERIKREIRLRKRVTEEAEGRAQSERIARIAAERRALEFEVGMATLADSNLETAIKGVTSELVAAKEAGETAKEVELQQKLNELQMKRRDVQNGKTAAEERLERAKAEPVKDAAPNGLRPITQQWIGRNKWFGAKGFEAQTAAARAIDSELAKEGKLQPDDPAYYVEFDRRIHREMPNLRQRLKKDAPQARSPVAAPSRSASAPAKKGRVVLTRSQLENMRNFGMDPNNREHLVEYAKNVGAQS